MVQTFYQIRRARLLPTRAIDLFRERNSRPVDAGSFTRAASYRGSRKILTARAQRNRLLVLRLRRQAPYQARAAAAIADPQFASCLNRIFGAAPQGCDTGLVGATSARRSASLARPTGATAGANE